MSICYKTPLPWLVYYSNPRFQGARHYWIVFPHTFHIFFQGKQEKQELFSVFGKLTDGKCFGVVKFPTYGGKTKSGKYGYKYLRENKTWKIWKFRTDRPSIITVLTILQRRQNPSSGKIPSIATLFFPHISKKTEDPRVIGEALRYYTLYSRHPPHTNTHHTHIYTSRRIHKTQMQGKHTHKTQMQENTHTKQHTQ